MRKALVEAGHHAKHRTAFGALLVDQPLMRNVLADLAVESEAATTLGAAAGRRGRPGDPRRRGRAGVPPDRHGDREVLGHQARARRSPPRRSSASAATATSRTPACRGSTARRRSTRSGRARATSTRSTCCARWAASPAPPTRCWPSWPGAGRRPPARRRGRPARPPSSATWTQIELRARRLVELMALALQGSLLVRHAPAAVADAFCATRLGGDGGPRVRHAAGRHRRRRHPRAGAAGRR